jgi:hypothetical protein
MAICLECAAHREQTDAVCPHCGSPVQGEDKRSTSSVKSAGLPYTWAGLIATAVTALLFLKFNYWALPVLGSTCGIATGSAQHCLSGIIKSAIFAFIVSVGLTVLVSHPLMSAGLFNQMTSYDYSLILIGSLLGASWHAPRLLLAQIANIMSILAFIYFVVVISWLGFLLPRYPVLWDYAVLIVAVPILGAGVWFPVDFVQRRLWTKFIRTGENLE